MSKKITLNELGDMLAHVVKHIATKEDLEKLATKEQLTALHMQVNSIEAQLKLGRYEQRLGHLEEKVFGTARS